jgi:hypothetical protein
MGSKGMKTVTMGLLRDVHGAGKLGVHVAAGISHDLDARGLAHYPDPLPTDQWARVRVYKRNSSIGKFIAAAFSMDDGSDTVLLQLASNDADRIVQRIRELVCD